MTMIEQVEKKVREINRGLLLSERDIPSFGYDNGAKLNYVLEENGQLKLINIGDWRGEKTEVIITNSIGELVFTIFNNATWKIATEYERNNRRDNQDIRILLFQKHIEILESLPLEKKYINELKKKYNSLLNMELFKI